METKVFLAGTFLFLGVLAISHMIVKAQNKGSSQARASIRILRASSAKEEKRLQIRNARATGDSFVSAFGVEAGEIALKGEPHQSMQIILPPNQTVSYLRVGENSLAVSDLHTFPEHSGTMSADGNLTLKVGARLRASENSDAGVEPTIPNSEISVVLSY